MPTAEWRKACDCRGAEHKNAVVMRKRGTIRVRVSVGPVCAKCGTKWERAVQSEKICGSCLYGLCPICGANGITRERRLNGNDRCSAGHVYPSRDAVKASRHGNAP